MRSSSSIRRRPPPSPKLLGKCGTIPTSAGNWPTRAASALPTTPGRIPHEPTAHCTGSWPIELWRKKINGCWLPNLLRSCLYQHPYTRMCHVLWVAKADDHILIEPNDESHQAVGGEVLQTTTQNR